MLPILPCICVGEDSAISLSHSPMFIADVMWNIIQHWCSWFTRSLNYQKSKCDNVAMLQLCWGSAWYHPEKAVWLAEPWESFASAAKKSNSCCDVTIWACTCHVSPVHFAGIMTMACISVSCYITMYDDGLLQCCSALYHKILYSVLQHAFVMQQNTVCNTCKLLMLCACAFTTYFTEWCSTWCSPG